MQERDSSTPRWLKRACWISTLVGLFLAAGGPMLIYAVAIASVDQAGVANQPEAAQQVRDAAITVWRGRLAWIVVVGMGMLFFGIIGLLFLWVTQLSNDVQANQQAP